MARGSDSHTTTDHEEIRKWAESRGGRPAAVKGTPDEDDGGLLRIDFGEREDNLEEIDWDRFFKTFDERKLAFLYQDRIDGKESRFFKLVRRDH
ncbi:MAG TPA: hypothetical protein VED40_06475 [Azospirillaceae bacterium]|nr:hypothetical protein [Azospirillaceae bacterium]